MPIEQSAKGDVMSHRYFHLLTKHQKLDEALRQEQMRLRPDFTRLQKLKRMKLAIKDRLNRLINTPLERNPA
jgi:uncharacterized protein